MKISQSVSTIAILMTAVLFSSCISKTQEESRDQYLPVRIERVKTEDVQSIIRSSGRLFPGSEQKLGFKTGGIINKIYVSEGEDVKQGQLLAELKVNEFKAMVRQASEAVAKSDRDFIRVSNFYRETVGTLEHYDFAVSDF